MASPAETATSQREIVVTSPWDGREISRLPVHDATHVKRVMERARAAQQKWAQVPVKDRARQLKRLRGVFIQRSEEVTDIVVRENGKTREEAFMAEVCAPVLHMTYYASKGPRMLRPRRVRRWGASLLSRGSYIHYAPRGVIGIISPWNYPLVVPVTDLIPSLLAGNAVVLKPSEWSPLTALTFKAIFDESGLDPDLFQVVTGFAETGAALIDSGIDMMVFTGSVKVGRIVGAACAERLIPCTLELGGKASLIALDDCNIERTARAVVWGGFFNAGQTCIGVERVLAHKDIHGPLLARVVELTKSLRLGKTGEIDMGAMPFPGQIDNVERLVDDARNKGADILTGGKRPSGNGRFYPPTVVANARGDMDIMHAEIFGPAVPFMQFESDEEAIRLNNESHLGLNAYVFGGDRGRCRAVADRLEAGTVQINDVVASFAYPELPFGGVKASGVGRNHGVEGLRHLCETRVVNEHRPGPKREIWWHPYNRKLVATVKKNLGRVAGLLDSLWWT